MRLAAFETGHDLPTRLTFGLLRRVAGSDIPAVVKVLAYRHRYFGTPYNRLVQAGMRGPSYWSVGERELFAAYTSGRNQCQFCVTAHSSFAGDHATPAAVEAALADEDDAGYRPEVTAVLALLRTLADDPDTVVPADVERVRRAGVPDQALEEAVRISVLFHVINRVMDAAGAGPIEGRELRLARRVVRLGYELPPTIRFLSRSR